MKKDTISNKIENLVKQVEDGNQYPLNVYIILKQIEDTLSVAMDKIKPKAIDEAELYPEREFVFNGFLIIKRKAPTRWNYDGINAIATAEDNLKKLKILAQNGGIDPDTGEIMKAQKILGGTIIAIKPVKK